jgi:hypothetical protein
MRRSPSRATNSDLLGVSEFGRLTRRDSRLSCSSAADRRRSGRPSPSSAPKDAPRARYSTRSPTRGTAIATCAICLGIDPPAAIVAPATRSARAVPPGRSRNPWRGLMGCGGHRSLIAVDLIVTAAVLRLGRSRQAASRCGTRGGGTWWLAARIGAYPTETPGRARDVARDSTGQASCSTPAKRWLPQPVASRPSPCPRPASSGGR